MEEDNLEKKAPRLSGIGKKNIFRTPEGIWDDFPFSVQQAISSGPFFSSTDKLIRTFSQGVSCCLFLCMILVGMNSDPGKNPGNGNERIVFANTSVQNEADVEKVEYYPFSFYAVSSEPLTKTDP